MIKPQNLGYFDKICTFQSVTITRNASGEKINTWADTYTGVRFRELLHNGNENFESDQQIWKRKKKIVIRKQGFTITQLMRFVYDSVNYYVTDVSEMINNRLYLVIEGEARDND